MEKVRLLQIAVYIVFTALFFQNAAAGFYKGFKEGFSNGVEDNTKPGGMITVIPAAVIDARLLHGDIDGKMLLNNNYKLEDIGINADIRVNSKLANPPWWLSAFDVALVVGNFLILLRLSIIMSVIIFNIYTYSIFNKKAVGLIRQTGFLLIIYSIADYLFQQETFLKSKYLVNPPVTILNTSDFNFELLMCGLLVLIVAEAFKQGVQLKEEQELTI
jgi:hypothetical protein